MQQLDEVLKQHFCFKMAHHLGYNGFNSSLSKLNSRQKISTPSVYRK